MPTGYTADLYEGKDVDFETFALTCARAFGAAILMRDDPPGPVDASSVTHSSYHESELDRLRRQLHEAQCWTTKQARAAAVKEHRETVASNAKHAEKVAALKERYEAMLAQAREWEPPTPDHDGLKALMVEQLESSIEFDCHVYEVVPEQPSADDFKAARVTDLEARIERAERGAEEDRERNEQRVAWVNTLRWSLGLDES